MIYEEMQMDVDYTSPSTSEFELDSEQGEFSLE